MMTEVEAVAFTCTHILIRPGEKEKALEAIKILSDMLFNIGY